MKKTLPVFATIALLILITVISTYDKELANIILQGTVILFFVFLLGILTRIIKVPKFMREQNPMITLTETESAVEVGGAYFRLRLPKGEYTVSSFFMPSPGLPGGVRSGGKGGHIKGKTNQYEIEVIFSPTGNTPYDKQSEEAIKGLSGYYDVSLQSQNAESFLIAGPGKSDKKYVAEYHISSRNTALKPVMDESGQFALQVFGDDQSAIEAAKNIVQTLQSGTPSVTTNKNK